MKRLMFKLMTLALIFRITFIDHNINISRNGIVIGWASLPTTMTITGIPQDFVTCAIVEVIDGKEGEGKKQLKQVNLRDITDWRWENDTLKRK